MKVAFITTGHPCGHDYGVDNLFTGLVQILGYDNVLDWPGKAPLHCPEASSGSTTRFMVPERDACNIDSDSAYPKRSITLDELREADVALIGFPPFTYDAARVSSICEQLPRSMPIAAVDASDRIENDAGWYTQVAGRPLAAYFKREYPIGEQWPGTFPLPLSYPARRVPKLEWDKKRLHAFYVATSHNGGAPGIPRLQIADALTTRALDAVWEVTDQRGRDPYRVIAYPQHEGWALEGTPGSIPTSSVPSMLLQLHRTQENRPSPEDYHDAMRHALIGISWNGADNWDCNRFWENLAYGLCQVAETPRIQIPNPPLDGVHCFYVNKPEAVAPLVWALLHDEDTVRRVARSGHDHYLKHHSSEARARYVLDVLGKQGA